MNPVFSRCSQRGHEQVSFFYDPVTKLKAIVAIHNTVLGPALGGCRMKLYDSEDQALEDVMRLSEGMTYKSSLAGLDLGGGKACIIADHTIEEGREELFKSFGRALNNLSGRYYTAEDMGSRVSDMKAIKTETEYCVGFPEEEGGSGDPSPWTALGVFEAIQAVCKKKLKKDLKDLKVAIEGLGGVGYRLAEHLHKEGVQLFVSDVDPKATKKAKDKLGTTVLSIENLYSADCDIFSPCAIGQTVNMHTIAEMKCSAIVGAANNQIDNPEVNIVLKEKGILYCPDFAINAGGVISVGAELLPGGWNKEWVAKKVKNIENTVIQIIEESEKTNSYPEYVALRLAEERIKEREKSNAT